MQDQAISMNTVQLKGIFYFGGSQMKTYRVRMNHGQLFILKFHPKFHFIFKFPRYLNSANFANFLSPNLKPLGKIVTFLRI